MDWSCKGILVPDSHMKKRNHSLHWELSWLFFTFFRWDCTIRSDSFHLSFPAPPCRGNTMKCFSRGTCLILQILEVAHTGSFLLHARNRVNMPRGVRCAFPCFLPENCEGTTKTELWNKQATVARRPKGFPTVQHQIRILPKEMSMLWASNHWDGRMGGWGGNLCSVKWE